MTASRVGQPKQRPKLNKALNYEAIAVNFALGCRSHNLALTDRAGVAATTPDGAWTYAYDLTDQLIRAQFASTNPSVPNQDLAYEYDALGNRVRTIFNGVTTNYTANSLNQYTAAGLTTFGYDLDSNLTQETGLGGTKTYTYDLQNRLKSITPNSPTNSNGLTTPSLLKIGVPNGS